MVLEDEESNEVIEIMQEALSPAILYNNVRKSTTYKEMYLQEITIVVEAKSEY
ncbi:hypothetical protein GCM10022216_18000 [Sphingobacterium kyonggiense]|uniref:Uncharacterized protein n=1 Tax=Sphingobacterium kyonggiense TaxID=714075 RepID=A0ABP7YQL3_9SPHI